MVNTRGVASILAAVLVLTLPGCQRESDNPPGQERVVRPLQQSPEQSGGRPIKHPGKGEGNEGTPEEDTPEVEFAELPPPAGSVYYLAPTGPAGDGSRASPFTDMRDALCRLEPGDRLIMLNGEYAGYVVLDSNCANGTRDAPIEWLAEGDAVVNGPGDRPVLEVSSDYWKIAGIELVGGRASTPAVVVSGATQLQMDKCHIHDGQSDGVLILPGSSGVSFSRCHVHQFGMPREDETGAAETDTIFAGIRIAPGTSEISIVNSRLHNIRGTPVITESSENWLSETGERHPPAASIVMRDNQIRDWQEED